MVNYFGFFLFCLMFGCTTKTEDLDKLCNGIGNSYECAKIIEQHQIPKYSGMVKRVDKKLIFQLDNDKELALEDKDKESQGSWFSFRDYLKEINSYIVHVQYYEGGAFCLINKKTGDKVDIPGLIEISPDKKRFVSYNIDLIAEYEKNGFTIYTLTNGTYKQEYDIELMEWGPSKVKWIDNSTIEIEKFAYTTDLKDTIIGFETYEKGENWTIKK